MVILFSLCDFVSAFVQVCAACLRSVIVVEPRLGLTRQRWGYPFRPLDQVDDCVQSPNLNQNWYIDTSHTLLSQPNCIARRKRRECSSNGVARTSRISQNVGSEQGIYSNRLEMERRFCSWPVTMLRLPLLRSSTYGPHAISIKALLVLYSRIHT
ncbi:hypothetical protein CPB85DRAFT_188041 [Mucidula mucida]|nr:hypothetical protein CPB85DRAFT_187746 [Mucidula mucida]KAF8899698.1 hypothetical protein CPB85DRAFT_188041 [Mucidula mucida]